MTQQELHIIPQESDPSWRCALELVRTTLDIPTVLPALVKNSWSGLYETKDFMHGIGFPGSCPRSLIRAAQMTAQGEQETPADVERAVSVLGVQFSSVIVAVNFVCRAALMQRPPQALWTPLFREMMTAIEVGYHFGCIAPDIGAAGGALMGFSHNAGLAVLLAHDVQRFADWRSEESDENSRQKALQFYGCEPYQVGAMTLQQLGFGPQIALAAALASGKLRHELIEVIPEVSLWRASSYWIDALRRGADFPTDAEARATFDHLPPAGVDGRTTESNAEFYGQFEQLTLNNSTWMWHLPKGSYEETEALLAKPRQSTVKGKVWKTSKREIIFEGRNS